MKNSFLNIGNKALVNTDKVICIVAADSDKVRRILARDNLKRTSPKVIDNAYLHTQRIVCRILCISGGYRPDTSGGISFRGFLPSNRVSRQ